ncbi:hypothetical protein ACQPZ2_22475 [Nocardia pseudovaccinii]|uniref:hypothetical protein n=1 Tax=Nocardia pseudovaccinii TaxID=189540 RepID=UPI003D89C2E9
MMVVGQFQSEFSVNLQFVAGLGGPQNRQEPTQGIHQLADFVTAHSVSRERASRRCGDRLDSASIALGAVRAPTLCIVGADDHVGLESSRRAQAAMPGQAKFAVVPGATHLFPEPGALSVVADLAGDWFTDQFSANTAEKHTAATG